VQAEYVNFHASAHGGALATLLDISTTLALFKLN
jgi:acyl-coenzyme A thioesterase PaaI-like protein